MISKEAKFIVLLHGWGADTNKLKPLAKELGNLGWEVFLPEIPGFGAPEPVGIWGVDEYSEYIYSRSLKKFKGKKFFVFGHSFGGRLAIKLAATNKDRIAGVILCAAAGISRARLSKRIFFLLLAKVGKVLNLAPTLAKVWQRFLYKASKELDYEKSSSKMRLIMRRVIKQDLKKVVKQIAMPTLIVWGKLDKATPLKDALYLEENIKQATIYIFLNEDHKLPYKKPKEVAGKIEAWHKSSKA